MFGFYGMMSKCGSISQEADQVVTWQPNFEPFEGTFWAKNLFLSLWKTFCSLELVFEHFEDISVALQLRITL